MLMLMLCLMLMLIQNGWDESHLSYTDRHLSKDGSHSQAEDEEGNQDKAGNKPPEKTPLQSNQIPQIQTPEKIHFQSNTSKIFTHLSARLLRKAFNALLETKNIKKSNFLYIFNIVFDCWMLGQPVLSSHGCLF